MSWRYLRSMGSMRDILPMPAMRAGQMSEVEMRDCPAWRGTVGKYEKRADTPVCGGFLILRTTRTGLDSPQCQYTYSLYMWNNNLLCITLFDIKDLILFVFTCVSPETFMGVLM